MIKKRLLKRLSLLLLSGTVAVPVWAQSYDRLAPKTLPAPPNVNAEPPAPTTQTKGKGTAIVIPELKGLVFVSNAAAIKRDGISSTGVSLNGTSSDELKLLKSPAFQQAASAYLGKPLTFDGLNQITAMVVNFYRAHEHPVVDVLVPEQDLNSGTVQILVTEFRVGKIVAKGNKWFSDKEVVAPLRLEHGDTIDSRQLLGYLDAANSNPFRQVNVIYQPSSQPGYTDLVLQTTDRFPLRVYTSFDNSGQPTTGRDRWAMGFEWGNALWSGQQISYQFTSSSDFYTGRSNSSGETDHASFLSHSLSWTSPMIGPGSFTVFGVYEQSSPNLGQDLGLLGKSGQAGIRYTVPLPRTEAFVENIQVGYDFKTTNNNLDFGGTQVSATQTEVDQFPIAYSIRLADKLGITSASTTLVYSPGGLTPANNDAAFQPAFGQSGRPFARANYTYLREDLNRLTKLPWHSIWSVRAITQYSDRALLDTEQLCAGGPDILRGYNPFSVLGDEGLLLSNEVRSRSFGRSSKEGFVEALPGQIQFLGFWDLGRLRNKTTDPSDPHDVNASSVGLGLRYNLRENVNVKFDYGWQLERLPIPYGGSQLASFALVLGN